MTNDLLGPLGCGQCQKYVCFCKLCGLLFYLGQMEENTTKNAKNISIFLETKVYEANK